MTLRRVASLPGHRCDGGSGRGTVRPPQGAVLEGPVDHLHRLQAELVQGLGRPAVAGASLVLGPGGFGDDQPAPDLQQGSGTLGHDGRPPERAGQYPVEVRPQCRLAPTDLGPLFQDR